MFGEKGQLGNDCIKRCDWWPRVSLKGKEAKERNVKEGFGLTQSTTQLNTDLRYTKND